MLSKYHEGIKSIVNNKKILRKLVLIIVFSALIVLFLIIMYRKYKNQLQNSLRETQEDESFEESEIEHPLPQLAENEITEKEDLSEVHEENEISEKENLSEVHEIDLEENQIQNQLRESSEGALIEEEIPPIKEDEINDAQSEKIVEFKYVHSNQIIRDNLTNEEQVVLANYYLELITYHLFYIFLVMEEYDEELAIKFVIEKINAIFTYTKDNINTNWKDQDKQMVGALGDFENSHTRMINKIQMLSIGKYYHFYNRRYERYGKKVRKYKKISRRHKDIDDALFKEFVEIFELLYLDLDCVEHVIYDVINSNITKNILYLLDVRNRIDSEKYKKYKSETRESARSRVYSFLNPYLYSKGLFGLLRVFGLIVSSEADGDSTRILEIRSLSNLHFLTRDRLDKLKADYNLEERHARGSLNTNLYTYDIMLHESVLENNIDINKIQSLKETLARDLQILGPMVLNTLRCVRIFLGRCDHDRLLDILDIMPRDVKLDICICRTANGIGSLYKFLTKLKSCNIKSTFSIYDGDGHRVIKYGVQKPELSGNISRIKFVDDFYDNDQIKTKSGSLLSPFDLLKEGVSKKIDGTLREMLLNPDLNTSRHPYIESTISFLRKSMFPVDREFSLFDSEFSVIDVHRVFHSMVKMDGKITKLDK